MGGVITSTGQATITITFPPGAVKQPVTLTLTLTETNPVSDTLQGVGASFAVEAHTANGQLLTHFLQPITITTHYSDADVAGIAEEYLRIYYWDVVHSVWVSLPTDVDSVANILTATLDHLTKFQVFGQTQLYLYLPVIMGK